MKVLASCVLCLLLVCAGLELAAEGSHGIPAEKVALGSIYWGKPSCFSKAACVNYDLLIQSTPEYKEIKKEKLSPSDAVSWILMSDAADRVAAAIAGVAKEKGYDLICAGTYWKNLKLDVQADDITGLVKQKVTQTKK